MSLRVWGALEFETPQARDEHEVEQAFKAVMAAAENKIGILVGYNVEKDWEEWFQREGGYLPFELADDPTTNVAESLFIGDGVKYFIRDKRMDSGERLRSRMSRVQAFLEKMLETRVIGKVMLVVDDSAQEGTVHIAAHTFAEEMVKMFAARNNFAPCARFVITRARGTP